MKKLKFLELFKGRTLIISPQVLSETYSLNLFIKQWLEILEDPYLKNLFENYIQKEEIMKEEKYLEFGFTDIAIMKSINNTNFLLTND